MITATQRMLHEQYVARRQRIMRAAVKPKPAMTLAIPRDPVADRPTIDSMIVSFRLPDPVLTSFYYSERRPRPPVGFVIRLVGDHYKIRRVELLSARRTAPVVLARHVGFWIAKQLTIQSLPEIGRQFGGKDHTTVLHGIRRIDAMRAASPEFTAETDKLKDYVSAAWKATGQ